MKKNTSQTLNSIQKSQYRFYFEQNLELNRIVIIEDRAQINKISRLLRLKKNEFY